jgi:hypothetical protein
MKTDAENTREGLNKKINRREALKLAGAACGTALLSVVAVPRIARAFTSRSASATASPAKKAPSDKLPERWCIPH